MQPCATSLYNVIENVTPSNPRDLTWLFEFYEYDTLPGPDGFDPADATQRFASIEITWLGYAYRRAVLSASDITKAKGSQANRCTLRLSNADENRYVATWVTQTEVEGMRLVVRLISRSASTTLAASNQRFSGRCDRPEGFDVIQGSISATEDVGGDDVEFPPRLYLADDPEGRSPADPLFEGFPLVTLAGSFLYQRPEADKRFSRKDPRRYFETLPWSSYDETPLGDPLMMILGRSQVRVYRGVFMDTGRTTTCLDFTCMGPIAGILNFRMDNTPEYQSYFSPLENVTYHLGDAGGTGTQLQDPLWPNHPLFSYTAYVTYSFRYIGTGAFSQIDAGHDTLMTVLGLTMALPDSSGDFTLTDWSDNGAYQTRLLLTGSRFFNIDPAFIEDSACFATGRYNDEPLVDESNSGQILIPDPEAASAGVDFQRYRSTSLINARRARYDLGLTGTRYEETAVDDFTPFDPFDPPLVSVDVVRLCKRFTSNVLLKKSVKAKDFLYKTLLPSFRGYLVWNYRGKIEPRSERPSDFAHLRAATSVGATTLLIEDATSWKASGGLWGQVYLGKGGDSGDTNSEIRKVAAAAYTSDANSITLSASKTGAVTVSASGSTLSGGNSTTRATGTITIGGSPAAGNTVTVAINGLGVTYTVESSETTATVAYMVAAHINANTQLRRFVSASASGSVVTVSSKWGVLTLSSALANAHGGPVANSTSAPSLTASGSGSSLAAGTYRVAYANRNATGSTYVSPYSSVTITAGQSINAPTLALPAGVTSRDWFLSKAANDAEMVLHTNTTSGTGFAMTVAPSSTAAFPPEYNTTGEEVVRIALPFASNNQTPTILAQSNLTRGNVFDGTYKWPGRREDIRYTEVVGSYVSAKDDFAASKVIVSDPDLKTRLGKRSPKELDLTAVDGYHQARRLAYFDFAKFVDRNWFNSLKSNGLALLIEEGDLICASDDSGGHVNILTQVEDYTIHLADFTVSINKARLYSTQMFRELVPKTRPLLPSVLKWVTPRQTLVELIDLPAITEADANTPGFYALFYYDEDIPGDWIGVNFWGDFGQGDTQLLSSDLLATVGTASDALGAGPPVGLDTTSTLTVSFKRGAPTSKTVDEIIADGRANLAVYGNEYIQFAACTLIDAATKTYTIGPGILRGRFGTPTAAHPTSERFGLMDAAVFVPAARSHLDETYAYKAQTVNEDLASATVKTFAWTGGTLKSPAPVDAHRRDDTLGNALIEFSGRYNAGQGLARGVSGYDSSASPETYEADVYGDAGRTNFKRTLPVTPWLRLPAILKSTAGLKSNGLKDITDTDPTAARSFQTIRQAGNFAEATLRLTETPFSALDARFGLIDARQNAWTDPSLVEYYVRLSYLAGYRLTVYRYGVAVSAPLSVTSSERVRITLVGSEVRFYRSYANDGSEPFYVSPVAASFPYKVWTYALGDGTNAAYVTDIRMTEGPQLATVYSAAQRSEDGTSSGPLYLNLYKIDPRVGRGYPAILTLTDEG